MEDFFPKKKIKSGRMQCLKELCSFLCSTVITTYLKMYTKIYHHFYFLLILHINFLMHSMKLVLLLFCASIATEVRFSLFKLSHTTTAAAVAAKKGEKEKHRRKLISKEIKVWFKMNCTYGNCLTSNFSLYVLVCYWYLSTQQ